MTDLETLLAELERENIALAQLVDSADDDDTRADARLLRDHVRSLHQTLQRPDGRIALIGPPGVGKSSALVALAGLYLDQPPHTVEAQRSESLITVGGGRTPASPLHVRPPQGDEPPDRISLVLTPLSPEDLRRLVLDVAVQELLSRDAAPDTISRPDPMSDELHGAVLNATGYGEYVVGGSQEGLSRRLRRVKPLDDVLTPDTHAEGLAEHLLTRLGERSQTRWTFDDTPQGRAALRDQLSGIKRGKVPDAALPARVDLALPKLASIGPVTLIDTRGLDGPLAVRSDLRELLEDPLTVPVLCGAFNNAPAEELLAVIRAMHDDPTLRPALGRAVVLLIDKGEAGAMVGAEGDRLIGQELKVEQCWERIQHLWPNPENLVAFDALGDDASDLLASLRRKFLDAWEHLEMDAAEALEDAERLLDPAQRASSAAVVEVIARALADQPLAEAPSLEPAAALGAALRSCPFSLRALTALRWRGELKNLHLLDAVAAEARAAADRWLAPTRSALLTRLARLEARGAAHENLVHTRWAALQRGFDRTVQDYGDAVRDELRQHLKNDPVWDEAAAEYPGRGFRERAAQRLDRWATHQVLHAHRQTSLTQHLPVFRRVQPPEEAPGFTLIVQNLRRLSDVRWPLHGVNLLIGANGSGKSTVNTALRFFAEALRDGPGPASAHLGAARTLRTWGAPSDAPVLLAIEKGGTRWAFTLTPRDSDRAASWTEWLSHRGEVVFEVNDVGRLRYRGEDLGLVGNNSGLSHLLRLQKVDPPLVRVAALAGGLRAHRVFNLHQLKAGGTPPLPERPLEDDGGNAFAVLLALKNAPGGQARYDFILESLRRAFPNLIEELGFRLTEHSVEVSVTAPGGHPPLYIGQQADGLLQYLVNLIAIVSAKPGDVIALDQPEDGLHPYAAQTWLTSAQDWAWDNRLTVIIATHSLVLLDAMGGAPERVFVMKPPKRGEPSPAPLTALYDREWLQGFTLGDLYANQNVGSNADEV
jgi:energy-coupling factor transporter ATP-binding protein EcfA2